ncbi:TetR/AcrR family transcriptional regulator [Nocardioides sp. cx-173]|uniref:TetR/AcrR family transcriptional regulator n=1 Tax=Nocardioides sp. cx-173 TaxID=2898796 RepID=UPI001E38FF08|nr:TetR/AcrR family transcriptional regulator [Nocardioides sp. cx-173]MCD4526969.1 TetR/AcrR family transcriptional regulator [Nocardioides sp. cx-173]UGB41096.1 TetR/AcrR family transcriptional regulator [Nocardioides sp. cx-173]
MPKISAETLAEHRDLVQRRVFDAFAALMVERSFDAISMAQIAAAAGLGRTAIYHHFPDKEAVVVAFASHETDRYLAGLRAELDSVADPVARMRVYVRHQLTAGEQFHMGLGMQLVGVLSRQAGQEIREHVVAVEDVLRDLLVSGVESGAFDIPDIPAAMSLIHACLAPRDVPAEQVERFILRALVTVD